MDTICNETQSDCRIPLFQDMLLFWISMYRFVKLLVVLFCSWKFHKAFLITERWTKKNLKQWDYSMQSHWFIHLKFELGAERFFLVFNFERINSCLEFLVVFLESKISIKIALKSEYSGYYLPFLADVVCVYETLVLSNETLEISNMIVN